MAGQRRDAPGLDTKELAFMPEQNLSESPNPTGLCRCGCGRKTLIATATRVERNEVKGQPRHYLRGHKGKGNAAGVAAGRLRAQKLYPLGPCERCGKTGRLRHHKDENTLNNAPENIEILCHRCHAKAHGLRGGVHWNTRKKRWVARPRWKGPQVFLGYFKTREAANQAVSEYLDRQEREDAA